MLSKVGEVNMHLGLFELESAGMSLLEDGVQVTLPDCPQPTVGAAKPEFTDDEIQAMRWKCRLPNVPVEFVIDMLIRLPQECINGMTEAFHKREQEVKPKTPQKTFLFSRDARLDTKTKAIQTFLDWLWAKHGALDPKQIASLRRGKIPYGWFADFVKEHAPLKKACSGTDLGQAKE